MAEAAISLCTLCQEDNLSSVAFRWCTECEHFICVDCNKHHSKNKSSKDHVTIDVKEYHNLPSFILNTRNQCEDHDFRYEFYCKFHDSVCCIKCTGDKHKHCRDIKTISEVFQNIKSSSCVLDSQKRLEDVHKDFEVVTSCLSDRLILLKSQKSKFANEVDSFRQLFVELIDGLQKQLLEKLSNEYDQIEAKTDILLTEVQDKETRIKHLQEDFVKMEKYATNLQTHLGLRVLDQVSTDETKFLKRLQTEQKLNEVSLDFEIASVFQSFLTAKKDTLGEVSVVTRPTNCRLKSEGMDTKQRQLSITKLNDKAELKLIETFSLPKSKSATTGCQIVPDGKLIFVGQNKFLVRFKEGGFVYKDSSPYDNPQDVSYTKDNIAAVTYPSAGKVCFIDISKDVMINEIALENCWAIDSDGENIAVGTVDKIILLTSDGTEIANLTGTEISHIALFNKNVYYTHRFNNTISCQSLEGRMLWEFKHKSVLKPVGIALDKDGYIYVSYDESKHIVVVSPDGQQGRVIFSKVDGLKHPYAISIDRKTSKLLVCQNDNTTAFLFKI